MKKFLFIVIGISIPLLFFELFLRLEPRFSYNYSSFRFKSEKLALNDFSYMRSSTLLGYEHIPNCEFNINSYGLIGNEYKLKKSENIFRILLLGDSIAEQDWTRLPLDESLNNNPLLNSIYKFEIWNAGVSSYDVRRYYLYLKYKGINYHPDMVIIYLFMNDFDLNINVYYKTKDGATEYYFPITEVSKKYNINPFFMKNSYLYRFIILRLDSYLLNKKKQQGITREEKDGRYYLQMIKDICEYKKIPLCIVMFPYLKPLDEYKDYQIEQYKIICEVIRDLKIAHINLYEHLSDTSLYKLRESKVDEIHPSPEAHCLIAKIIYEYLLNNFFKN